MPDGNPAQALGRLRFGIEGLALADAGLQQALGTAISGETGFDLAQGNALDLSGLTIRGEGFGLKGDIRADGATFEQYLGKALEPKFLLDVGVEAVNLFVPGTQLARIVVEQGVKRLVAQKTREH